MRQKIDAKNREICDILESEVIDTEHLKQLVEQRHQLITTYLTSLDEVSAKAFAEQQISLQQKLQTQITEILGTAKSDFSKFINARKLAAKYK